MVLFGRGCTAALHLFVNFYHGIDLNSCLISPLLKIVLSIYCFLCIWTSRTLIYYLCEPFSMRCNKAECKRPNIHINNSNIFHCITLYDSGHTKTNRVYFEFQCYSCVRNKHYLNW